MEDLAPRQKEVLDFIASSVHQLGLPPSLREIGDALGIRSTNGVADHVKALIRKGYLERVSSGGAARAIRLTAKSTGRFHDADTVAVPVVGRVAAGMPIFAQEHYEGTLHVDASMVPAGSTVFALVIRGDSMIGDGILDGDTVFVRQQQTARNGEIVIAMLDDEATCKRFFHEGDHVRLDPSNADMEPIVVAADQPLVILGVVVGLFRSVG
jgi:repressor LexA